MEFRDLVECFQAGLAVTFGARGRVRERVDRRTYGVATEGNVLVLLVILATGVVRTLPTAT